MKKTHKKIENDLRRVLTHACDMLKDEVDGFNWLSHTVNYNSIDESLVIDCYFDNADSIEQVLANEQDAIMRIMIKKALAATLTPCD